MIRVLTRLLSVFTLAAAGLGVAAAPAGAAGCPPAGATWSSTAQGAAHNLVINGITYTVIAGTGSNGGSDLWANDSTGSWGDCETQPVTSPDNDKGYPHIALSAPNGGLGSPVTAYSEVKVNSFTVTTPGSSTYEWATDEWLNGHPGDTGVVEVMMWVSVHGTTPAGSDTGVTTSCAAKTWDLWVKGGSAPTYTWRIQEGSGYTSGTIPVRCGIRWLESHTAAGCASSPCIDPSLPLTELDFGAEVADTQNLTKNFEVDNYSTLAQ